MSGHDNLLFLGTSYDKPFLPKLKSCVGSAKVFLSTEQISTLFEVEAYCKKRGITGVITTSPVLLQKLLPQSTSQKAPSVDNFAGSLFTKAGIEYVIVHPLEHTITVPYGEFLLKRYTSKLVYKSKWIQAPQFNWCILTLDNIEHEYELASRSHLCAVDIETYKENLAIRCIGFTTLTLVNGSYISRSTVLPMDTDWCYAWTQKFLSIGAPKILQNGKYDINYLMRYSLILNNYAWDTATLMHCWYSELPKDLASLSAFFVRESMYWKDLAETNDLETYYLYNAKDTHQTALVLLGWINEAPSWAHTNYRMEFPMLFPCVLSELTGIARDLPKLTDSNEKITAKIKAANENLSTELGVPSFNTNSPPQKKALLKILGCADLDATDEKNLAKARLRHPLNQRILSQVSTIQKDRKLLSTYLVEGKELSGTSRILWSLNPHGTDTGRLASKEHHFWCGLQIQNIPRGQTVKATLCADAGFYLGESDLEQAESRDTAYITGDKNLIAAVSSGKDFHAVNASSFFGIPYESIYDDATGKTLDKKLRDLAKRVNHGASYNMGWSVLIDTMGEDKIQEAQRLLKLPTRWTLREVAEHLLNVFTLTYPDVRIGYQDWIRRTVSLTHKLTGATGWTRYCFSDPTKSKTALNGYVAHNPQSLNAMTLNVAYLKVFYEIALPNPRDFKLMAQIHDSIFFQYRIGHEHLAQKVKSLMEIPVDITDVKGIKHTFTVPAALKCGKKYWSELE
jgi:DNA polymerase I-like protein with 3'-5' exonuclease and polymerase domains